jgi:hypothetical protein
MPENKPDVLRLEVESHVAVLTIDRPTKLNALDDRAVRALREICDRIERMDLVRAVILTGAGDKAFSAGGDIDAWSAEDAEAFSRFWVRNGHEAFDALARLRQPVIALLNGHALGGGLELAAVADLRVAEEHVKIGSPFWLPSRSPHGVVRGSLFGGRGFAPWYCRFRRSIRCGLGKGEANCRTCFGARPARHRTNEDADQCRRGRRTGARLGGFGRERRCDIGRTR